MKIKIDYVMSDDGLSDTNFVCIGDTQYSARTTSVIEGLVISTSYPTLRGLNGWFKVSGLHKFSIPNDKELLNLIIVGRLQLERLNTRKITKRIRVYTDREGNLIDPFYVCLKDERFAEVYNENMELQAHIDIAQFLLYYEAFNIEHGEWEVFE